MIKTLPENTGLSRDRKDKDRGFVVIGANVGRARDVPEVLVKKRAHLPHFHRFRGEVGRGYKASQPTSSSTSRDPRNRYSPSIGPLFFGRLRSGTTESPETPHKLTLTRRNPSC